MAPKKKKAGAQVVGTDAVGKETTATATAAPVPPLETTEPVVLQLMISNDRMTEIVNATSACTCQDAADPEPYNPVETFASTEIPQGGVANNEGGAHTMVCFWCCHSIVDKEFGMPLRYDSIHNSFTLYGCFCSLECAAAHNFSVHMGSDRAWEIHSWIQLIARRYGYAGRVRPAPSKFLLKLFGGPLTIEEFRTTHKGLSRSYVINIPPFIHVASQMEVLNTSFLVK